MGAPAQVELSPWTEVALPPNRYDISSFPWRRAREQEQAWVQWELGFFRWRSWLEGIINRQNDTALGLRLAGMNALCQYGRVEQEVLPAHQLTGQGRDPERDSFSFIRYYFELGAHQSYRSASGEVVYVPVGPCKVNYTLRSLGGIQQQTYWTSLGLRLEQLQQLEQAWAHEKRVVKLTQSAIRGIEAHLREAAGEFYLMWAPSAGEMTSFSQDQLRLSVRRQLVMEEDRVRLIDAVDDLVNLTDDMSVSSSSSLAMTKVQKAMAQVSQSPAVFTVKATEPVQVPQGELSQAEYALVSDFMGRVSQLTLDEQTVGNALCRRLYSAAEATVTAESFTEANKAVALEVAAGNRQVLTSSLEALLTGHRIASEEAFIKALRVDREYLEIAGLPGKKKPSLH